MISLRRTCIPQVNRGITDALPNVLDDLIRPKVVDIVGHDKLETDLLVVFDQLGALSVQNITLIHVYELQTQGTP